MIGVLIAATLALGPVAMFNLYFMPYWVGVVWLDIVTYLHHHGSEDPGEQVPWYRGEVGSLLGLGFRVQDSEQISWHPFFKIPRELHHSCCSRTVR